MLFFGLPLYCLEQWFPTFFCSRTPMQKKNKNRVPLSGHLRVVSLKILVLFLNWRTPWDFSRTPGGTSTPGWEPLLYTDKVYCSYGLNGMRIIYCRLRNRIIIHMRFRKRWKLKKFTAHLFTVFNRIFFFFFFFFYFPTHNWFNNHLKHLGRNQAGCINQPGMALTPFPFSILEEIRTHDLLDVRLLCYQLNHSSRFINTFLDLLGKLRLV